MVRGKGTTDKKAVPAAVDKSLESWIWDAACTIRGARGGQSLTFPA